MVNYTEPRILESDTGTWSVYFTYTDEKGKKKNVRISTGKEFGWQGLGNGKNYSTKYKRAYFGNLRNIVSERLSHGWYPGIENYVKVYTLNESVKGAIERVNKQNFSTKYKKHLVTIGENLLKYIPEANDNVREVLTTELLRKFLHSYAQGCYFNNQKAHLSAFIERMVDLGFLETNPAKGLQKLKAYPSNNLSFTKIELDALFPLLKKYNQNLYLACILMYTLLLRPHEEIRALKRGFFNEDLSVITIPSGYTKNGKGRNIPVPVKSRAELISMNIQHMGADDYVFGQLFNPYYFSLLWKRFKKEYPDAIKPHQTLYSLRHSAAIYIYKRTGSLQKVKTAMDHSNIEVTLGYLRSLNVYENTIDMVDLADYGL